MGYGLLFGPGGFDRGQTAAVERQPRLGQVVHGDLSGVFLEFEEPDDFRLELPGFG